MKKLSILTVLFILLFIMACNNTSTKHENNALTFAWAIQGQIPDSSIGLAGPVTGISNDVLIVGGGSNFPNAAPWDGGAKKFYNEVYVFKQEKDSLVPLKKKFSLPYKVAYSANCSIDAGIVIAGGQNIDGALNNVSLLHWDENTRELQIDTLPNLPFPLSSGALAARGNQLYFAGGQNENKVSNQLYHLDLSHSEARWVPLTYLPHAITHAVLYATGNSLYLVGGRKSNPDSTSTLYDEVFQFDLNQKEWNQKTSLPYALSAHTGVVWNDSTLLVFSGDRGKTFHEIEVLIMKIAREKDPDKKRKLMKEKNALQKSHPGFSGTVLAYHVHQDSWEKVDSIPFSGQVTTTAMKWGTEVVIPCGEIRAGVRTANIVLGKLKSTN